MVCFVIKLMHFSSTILTFVQFFFHLIIDSIDSININFFKNQKIFVKRSLVKAESNGILPLMSFIQTSPKSIMKNKFKKYFIVQNTLSMFFDNHPVKQFFFQLLAILNHSLKAIFLSCQVYVVRIESL